VKWKAGLAQESLSPFTFDVSGKYSIKNIM